MDDIRTEHDALCARLAEIPKARWREPGVWGDRWTLSDLVAHLAEWQHMFLGWHAEGQRGATPEMPAPGFKWSQTPGLNRAIWEKHRSRSPAAVRADFDSGYRRIVRIVAVLSPRQLLRPGQFEWTGKHPLATYLGPNTASHYRFASKVIHRWLRDAERVGPAATRPQQRLRPLWTCPRCGLKFVSRNLPHSCGRATLADWKRRMGPRARQLYRRFEQLIARCGAYHVSPAKTRIAFLGRVRFAGITRLSEDGMTWAFALPTPLRSRRFVKVAEVAPGWWSHQLRVSEPAELDAEVQAWLRRSYRLMGMQGRLKARPGLS